MLPRELKPPFLEFLEGVDHYTSYEVDHTKGRVGETATTGTLLRCLDTELPPLQGLTMPPALFQAALDELASDLPGNHDVRVSITGEGFSQLYENHVVQSDYAVHLAFRDTSADEAVARAYSWDAHYFLQSKVARTPGDDADIVLHSWASNAKFGQTKGQSPALQVAKEKLGNLGILYNLYCPNAAIKLDPSSHVYAKLKHDFETRLDEWNLVENAGLWISLEFPRTIGDLFKSRHGDAVPWSTFILHHYFATMESTDFPCERVYHDGSGATKYTENRRRLFDRDDNMIRCLEAFLIEKGVRESGDTSYDFSNHKHRPRLTISLRFPAYDYINKPDPRP